MYAKVKKYESGVVKDPITIQQQARLGELAGTDPPSRDFRSTGTERGRPGRYRYPPRYPL